MVKGIAGRFAGARATPAGSFRSGLGARSAGAAGAAGAACESPANDARGRWGGSSAGGGRAQGGAVAGWRLIYLVLLEILTYYEHKLRGWKLNGNDLEDGIKFDRHRWD